MKPKLIPIASVIIGIVAFLLTYQYLRSREQDLAALRESIYEGAGKIRVMAAARDIPSGTVLRRDDLGVVEVFESSVHGRAVLPEHGEMLLGRKTMFNINRMSPVMWSDIEGGLGAGTSLAEHVTPGLRALSLSIGGANAVSGMVRPNDRVDVLGTFTLPSKTNPELLESVTLTVLQDVTVIATGQRLATDTVDARGRADSGYSTVTLAITPREAELLVFVQQTKGSLTLTLRNPNDVSFEQDLPEINFEKLEAELPELNLYRQRNIRHKRNL